MAQGQGCRPRIWQWMALAAACFYAALILFFSFFWVATQFHAVRIADELKSGNSYIPGIRPGMPTAEYLDMTMTRVTLIGAVGLIVIAVIPTVLSQLIGIPPLLAGFFGGTSLLIIVGVFTAINFVASKYWVFYDD